MKPTRDDAAGRAYLDLQAQARTTKRPVDELLHLYVLEGFLERLSRSSERANLVLKGGVLLAAFGDRRPTRDVDLQARQLDNDAGHVRKVISGIASIPADDGIRFDHGEAASEVIRDEDAYRGVRVTMWAHLSSANVRFHVDVNVGDPVTPSPGPVAVSRLLGGYITVLGYPLAMVHAEKLETAVARGTANTRWRDFMDVVALSRRHRVDGHELMTALQAVAAHRRTEVIPLTEALDGYGVIGQQRWAAWRR